MIRQPMFNFSQTYIDHGYFEISLPSAATKVRKTKLKIIFYNIRNNVENL